MKMSAQFWPISPLPTIPILPFDDISLELAENYPRTSLELAEWIERIARSKCKPKERKFFSKFLRGFQNSERSMVRMDVQKVMCCLKFECFFIRKWKDNEIQVVSS